MTNVKLHAPHKVEIDSQLIQGSGGFDCLGTIRDASNTASDLVVPAGYAA